MLVMGSCMSTSGEESDQRKRSNKIDKELEEDSKRLRKECKILLLGTLQPARCSSPEPRFSARADTWRHRFRRERKVDDCEADEDYPPKGLLTR